MSAEDPIVVNMDHPVVRKHYAGAAIPKALLAAGKPDPTEETLALHERAKKERAELVSDDTAAAVIPAVAQQAEEPIPDDVGGAEKELMKEKVAQLEAQLKQDEQTVVAARSAFEAAEACALATRLRSRR
jgi:hypothetical protein